jgi:hypothetical protein
MTDTPASDFSAAGESPPAEVSFTPKDSLTESPLSDLQLPKLVAGFDVNLILTKLSNFVGILTSSKARGELPEELVHQYIERTVCMIEKLVEAAAQRLRGDSADLE